MHKAFSRFRMKRVFLLLLAASHLSAELYFDGQLRLRHETFHNANEKYYGKNPTLGKSHTDYLLTRAKLGFVYAVDDTLLFKVSGQDARAPGWGFESDDWYNKEFNLKNNTQEDYLELHDSYVKKTIGDFELRAGRQKLAFGDRRVFGPGEWKNSGKWIWDVVKLTYKKDADWISFFYGKNMLHDEKVFSLEHRSGYLGYGFYSHVEFDKSFILEPMLFGKENKIKNGLYNSLNGYYGGARFLGDVGDFYYDGTALKAFGEREDTSGYVADIDALALVGLIGYKANENLKLGFEYVYASGDDKNSKSYNTFDTAFGASDLYYGRQNMMQFTNIHDSDFFAIYHFLQKFRSKFEYHRFVADKADNKWLSYEIDGMQNSHYGDEADLVTTYKHAKNLSFQLGLTYFMAGSYIKEASVKRSDITYDDSYSIFTQLLWSFNTK